MSSQVEYSLQPQPQPVASEYLPSPLTNIPLESKRWLLEYEKNEHNIFKYYLIDNEVTFIRSVDSLPQLEQEYYLQENVKRFLSEFVGKVPYTTIPYSIDQQGFNYGGMKVMDSYQKAADLGGDREKAETYGFKKIEEEMQKSIDSQEKPQSAFWISPPKNWDYGFVFALIPDSKNHVREYILRYDEPRNSLQMSNDLMYMLSDRIYQNTDDYLRHPIFINTNSSDETLDMVMRSIGIDEYKVAESRQFEQHIDDALTPGINMYVDMILRAAQIENNTDLITQAKLLLIQLYRQAEQIQSEITPSSKDIMTYSQVPTYQTTSFDNAGALYSSSNLDSGPLITSGGSCPAIQDEDPNPFAQNTRIFTSSFDHILKLQKGPLESFFKQNETSFACPQCGTLIPSGQGITQCPNKPACGITKDEYAAKINGVRCD
jgi:hypothetical protein